MFKNKEPVKGINPDEAVAYGAAVQVYSLFMFKISVNVRYSLLFF